MTLQKEDKQALINYKIERSELALEAAIREFEAEDMFTASNRIYYACFYSTEALMLTKDLSFKDHGRLKGEFNKRFVHEGLVDKKYSKILDNAFEQRQAGDYKNFVKFTKEEVKSSLDQAKIFVKDVIELTLKIIKDISIDKTSTEIENQPDKNDPDPDIDF